MAYCHCTAGTRWYHWIIYLAEKKVKAAKKMNAWWFFLLTLAAEYPVVLFFYRNEWRKALLPCLLLNLFTWPLLHYLLFTTHIPLVLMEIGVVLAEMTGYKLLLKSSWTRSFVVALTANGISYALGLLINNYI